jgi:ribulose-phosphate 3-epimerase
MLEIIPSINRENWQEVEKDLKAIESFSEWVEIDVLDGSLSKRISWNNFNDLKNIKLSEPLKIAIHLMVKNPQNNIESLVKLGIRRIIIQYEGLPKSFLDFSNKQESLIKNLADICHNNWIEFGLSISPKTSVKKISYFLKYLEVVQILAVPIGESSYGFNETQTVKAQELDNLRNKNNLNYKIEWDGGIDSENIEKLKDKGIDLIASTSFIFNSQNPQLALEALRRKALGL